MTDHNLYSDLQKMAVQSTPTSDTRVDIIDNALSEQATTKLKTNTEFANTMYPEDSITRFEFWKSKNKPAGMDVKTKSSYWKTYETMHPEGIVGAKRDFLAVTKRELEVIDSVVGKEFFLRERLENSPSWARQELDPILAELSATVANANYSKAQQVYMVDLNARAQRFVTTAQLDPDVSIEAHTNDAVRLEQLNLMDLVKTKSGRIGVHNEKGIFYPAFGIKDRTEIFEKDLVSAPSLQEQSVVRDLAPSIIRKAIEGNLALSRTKVRAMERTGETVAKNHLTSGAFALEQWDTAFAMLPDVPILDKIKLGLSGEFAAGRINNSTELTQVIYQALVKYGPYLGEII